jgi:hypothetical protein
LDYFISNQAEFEQYRCHTFAPGDRICFAKGSAFRGQFAPKGSGSAEHPIWVTAYDPLTMQVMSEPITGKPVIHGLGQVDAVVKLFNQSFWQIENLEMTNTNGSQGEQGNIYGIHVIGEDVGLLEHIHIRYCTIHHVNGCVGDKWRGGIHLDVYGNQRKTWFDDVLIEQNVIQDVGGVGISNTSTWKAIQTEDWTPWTRFIVRNNWVERTGRNAIILRVSEDLLIEYNTCAYNSRADVGHSVLTFDTRRAVMQYNEAYGNTGDPEDADRGGFDADFKCEDTIIQYNYSHDNHWFCGIMRKYNKRVIIRYNVSMNELMGAYLYGFPADDGLDVVTVHDNLHYFKAGSKVQVFPSPRLERTPIKTHFRNNVFFFAEPAAWGPEPAENCLFDANYFYNVAPRGTNAVTDTSAVVGQMAHITSRILQAGVRITPILPQTDHPVIVS